MHRRHFLKNTLALPALTMGGLSFLEKATAAVALAAPFQRVRPGDAGWPNAAAWKKLEQEVNGHLIKVVSPLDGCKVSAANCQEVFKTFLNPYAVSDSVALTQSSGWLNAWNSTPSVYAVKAHNAQEVAAAVNFARRNKLRLVVKGGGHSYQGTSNAPDSLMIWTKAMNNIQLHDQFTPKGGEGKQAPRHAVTMGAGVVWMHAYHAVTVKGGRYVQGGGCATVGVAGLIQSGGFGSYSKRYGMAAARLLEAEVVTADGRILIVNEYQNADLFWGLKGGGGGSLAVVTQLTLQTRELPNFFGGAFGLLKANSDEAYKKMLVQFISFYQEKLFNPHWGEQIRLNRQNELRINMVLQGLNTTAAQEVWKPFVEWVAQYPQDYTWAEPFSAIAIPAQKMWDGAFFKQVAPEIITQDNRPGAPEENIFWSSNVEEMGAFWHAYHSMWLPSAMLEKDKQSAMAEAMFAASRHWTVGIHFNKGLAGSPAEEIEAARNTAMNPGALDAFALAIIAGCGDPSFPGVQGHEPDLANAQKEADRINQSMDALRKVAPNAGSYVSESSYFEPNFQQSYWGSNYARLATVKKKYDPEGLFFVHNGVGSEGWSKDGFTKTG